MPCAGDETAEKRLYSQKKALDNQMDYLKQQLNGYMPQMPSLNIEMRDVRSGWNQIVKNSIKSAMEFDVMATGCKMYRKVLTTIDGMNSTDKTAAEKQAIVKKAIA